MRKLHIAAPQYQQPIASCDTCLSTRNVQVRLVPVVDGEGSPLRVLPPMQCICNECLTHATRLASDSAIDGAVVYLHWSQQTNPIVRAFVFTPLMFRNALF